VTVDYNLVFLDAKAMKISPNAALLRDVVWPSQTCTIGYAVAGTWNNTNYKNNPTTTTAVYVGKVIQDIWYLLLLMLVGVMVKLFPVWLY
jgi:hypothetical protein